MLREQAELTGIEIRTGSLPKRRFLRDSQLGQMWQLWLTDTACNAHASSKCSMAASWQTQDHVARRRVRVHPAVAKHNTADAARIKQSNQHGACQCGRRRRHRVKVQAVSAETRTALTPLLQLQKRLESSGASVNNLDLSYKQCVAARKARQGEVLPSCCLVSPACLQAFVSTKLVPCRPC